MTIFRPGVHNVFVPDFGVRVTSPGGVAAIPWYLSGGVAVGDVAGVWQAKGAASLAASYLRLAGDQGYANIDPAIVGGVAPTWDAATGWYFNFAEYMMLGVRPTSKDWSVIVRFSNCVAGLYYLCGSVDGAARALNLIPNHASGIFYGNGSGYTFVAPGIVTGTLAVCGTNCYRNGMLDGSFGATDSVPSHFICLGCAWVGGGPLYHTRAYVQDIAAYKTTLTDAQVLAISTAMP